MQNISIVNVIIFWKKSRLLRNLEIKTSLFFSCLNLYKNAKQCDFSNNKINSKNANCFQNVKLFHLIETNKILRSPPKKF